MNTGQKENRFFRNFRLKYYNFMCIRKLGSKNSGQNILKYKQRRGQLGNLSSYEHEWEPSVLSRMCENGNHVPYSEDLFSFISQFVPAAQYTIYSEIDYPKLKKLQFNYKWEVSRLVERLNIPDTIGNPAIKWERSGFRTCLLHSVWDEERVEYYKKRMMEERYYLPKYIPTVLLITPPKMNSLSHVDFATGLVLDGHHKIQAAAQIGSPLRVIFIEMQYNKRDMCPCCCRCKICPILWNLWRTDSFDYEDDNDNNSINNNIEFYLSKLRYTRNSKKCFKKTVYIE